MTLTKEEKQRLADELLDDSTFIGIFAVDDALEQADLKAKACLRASELGIKRIFEKKLKAYEDEEKRLKKERRIAENSERETAFPAIKVDGIEYDQMLCGQWVANSDGIYQIVGYNKMIACSHPILPVRTLYNAEFSTYKTELAYYRRGKWMSTIVDKSVIASRSSIVRLSDMDIAVNSENAGTLVRYLADIESLNEIDIVSSASRLGWHGENFVPYCDDIVFDAEARFTGVFGSIKQHGSFNAWMDAVKRVRETKRVEPRFFMAASFASVIVHLCNALPFICNLYGDTEGGKTVTTKLCTSVWADPTDNHYWSTFKSTDVAIEIRLNFLNHLPLILDDHANVPPFFDVSSFSYMTCNGAGKDRSTKELGNRPPTSWQNITITNGEQPLTDNETKAGAANRILDFEAGHTQIYGGRENSVELCRVLHENYGFAGRMFVEACQKMGRDAVVEIQKRHLAEIEKLEGKMDKQSMSLSIIMAADEIAERCIFKDGIRLRVDEVSCVLADASAISENQRCYDYLMDAVNVNLSKFVPEEIGDQVYYKTERWGCKDKDYVYIIPSVFSKLVADGGGKRKSFLSWLRREKKLKHNPQKNDFIKKMPDGQKIKVYAVQLVQIDYMKDEDRDFDCEL